MAGCSSNFVVARVVNVGKETVTRNLGNQDSSRLSFRGVMMKESVFPIICDRLCVSRQKKQTFFIMSMSQPPPVESQSGVTAVEFSKGGGDCDSVTNKISDGELESKTDRGDSNGVVLDSSGGNGGYGNGGVRDGDGGGGGDGDGNDKEEEEFGPILKYDEVLRETEARGATLPLDMLEAAKSVGIRKLLLLRYLDLQV